ncbi:phospholipid scramblase-related protein [Flavobacterium sp. DG1-102-2]|uniref:phospholipid scramblase-related protein n=1 Tax=Flavobacterium sp. DG1-102-2 TaxID=3081663 RepID=UPI0029496BD9|nr:phospholipid scramblase-related protein [Flavobacterium sp. DG1-102-2]MDV6170010.1 phospholipid scramblase-related protein [Flavobacterium sp. DG1-102-2]
MSSDFFESNSYFIDEKVNLFKFENVYQLYDDKGQHIGAIKQKLTTGQKLLRLLLNKGMLPFMLEIVNLDGKVQATVSRGWTFWMSKIVITDANGVPVGSIAQKFKLFKPTFKISDNAGVVVGQITGDWKAWNFKISDAKENQIGAISKKWAGAMKEIFTTADKYNVVINDDYADKKNKLAILAGAITIDMVLKEAK